MWIPRYLEAQILDAARTRPVLVLTGARQTGKTSTLRRLFPGHSFVSLDLPSEAAEAENAPEEFLRRHPAPVIIDEVQYAPGLFRHLKSVVDENRSGTGSFLLTGSQKFTLMKEVSDSLAGRASVLELGTLSLGEIRGALPGFPILDALLRGGFPELYANPEIDRLSFYNSYIATYLERDIRALAGIGRLRDFERFLRACALRTANRLNKSQLARDVGVAPNTSNAWLSVLEASGQLVLLEPWFSNRTKSITKSPKLHLADSGLLCALLNVRDVEQLRSSPMIGAIWESFVFVQIRHREQQSGRPGALYYWVNRDREVDVAIDRGGRVDLYEIKWTELPSTKDAASLRAAARALGEDVVASESIICRAANPFPMKDGVRVVPVDSLPRN